MQYSETIIQIIVTAQQEGSLLPATAAQGGKVHLEFLVGACHLVLQILTLSQTKKKCHFPHPFSDLTSKIRTRF